MTKLPSLTKDKSPSLPSHRRPLFLPSTSIASSRWATAARRRSQAVARQFQASTRRAARRWQAVARGSQAAARWSQAAPAAAVPGVDVTGGEEVEGSGASVPGGGASAAGICAVVPGVDVTGGEEVACGGAVVPGGGASAAGTVVPGDGASAAGIRTTVPGIDSLGEVGRRSPKNAITRPGSTMPLAPPLAVAGAVYDDIVGAYRGFMPSRTRAFLVIHRGLLEPHVRCPYCGARVWSMTAAGLARLSSSSSSDGERSADSDSNHSDDESFAAADVSLPLPLASRVSGRRLRGRPAM
uniref:Uncharacterized protein n=2 Tax=Oryza sativa subsp. japonica TaxID=39947 RepID=A0A5S6R6V8_ORYSJ|nr:Hypothetical protein [Oryza sativa Japonica Group]AAM08731.1 Hypothetical protein [Oryza sativa Japonica Group]AAP51920.1 hypothetical protein LOC_Os10g03210 [Oryza sativa Japonica Group]